MNFYQQCWGGQGFIHVGLYNDLELFPGDKWKEVDDWEINEYIRKSSFAAVRKLLEIEYLPGPDSYVMDMGSGLGGTARLISKSFGSKVTCIDLSEAGNKQNVEQNRKEGLSHLITVPSKSSSFLDTGEPSGKYDLVVSQDSFLHAGSKRKWYVLSLTLCIIAFIYSQHDFVTIFIFNFQCHCRSSESVEAWRIFDFFRHPSS